MVFFNNKLGKRIDSKVMLATATDSLGDVITTSATVISIIICHFTSINVDAIASLIVSAIVIQSGISIAKDTLEPLIGERVPAELYQKITDIVESYAGIVGTHNLIIHNYGPNHNHCLQLLLPKSLQMRFCAFLTQESMYYNQSGHYLHKSRQ